jgi:plasmid stabilization system protein ParE
MSLAVEYTLDAKHEIREVYLWIRARLPQAAERWRDELIEKVDLLAVAAKSHPRIPESARFKEEVRQFLHGKRRGQFRVIYLVEDTRVIILSVRHSSRAPLKEGDLPV